MDNLDFYKDDVFEYILDHYKVTFEVKPKVFNGEFFRNRISNQSQKPNAGLDTLLIDLFLSDNKVTDIHNYLVKNKLNKKEFYYDLLSGFKYGYWTMKVNQKLPKFEFEQGKEFSD